MPWPQFVLALKAAGARNARALMRQMTAANWGVERALANMFGSPTLEYDAALMKVERLALIAPVGSGNAATDRREPASDSTEDLTSDG